MLSISILAFTLCLSGLAHSANRDAVYSTLNQIIANWPEANLQARLIRHQPGSSDSVHLREQIRYSVNSAMPGYVSMIHVDSHGNASLLIPLVGTSQGYRDLIYPAEGALVASEPLGKESVYVFFTEEPLDRSVFGMDPRQDFLQSENSVQLTQQFHDVLTQQKSSQKLAVASIDYFVEAPSETQYTTRAIVRHFAENEKEAEVILPARIHFEFDSAILTEDGKRNLDTFGEALKDEALTEKAFVLAGHTDDIGSEEYNLNLSVQRANSAKQYLVESFGIDPGRIATKGLGESKPIETPTSAEARAKNRRVDFVLVKDQ